MNRRAMLSTTALAAPAALAACSIFTPANVATVEQVIAKIQAVMPYVSGIANVLGAVVPGVSGAVSLVNQGLNAAASVFATMTSSMTAAAAQPVVSQIVTYVSGAVTSAKTIIAALPVAAQATANALLAEAATVLGDLNAFANPTAVSAPATPTVPVHLFIREVK